jgi:hypothetical protein
MRAGEVGVFVVVGESSSPSGSACSSDASLRKLTKLAALFMGGFTGRAVEMAARSSLAVVVVVVVFVVRRSQWAFAPQKWSMRLTKVRRSPARIPQNSPRAFDADLSCGQQEMPRGNISYFGAEGK